MPIQSMTNMLKEGMRAAISCQILEGDLPLTFRFERNGKALLGTGYNIFLIFMKLKIIIDCMQSFNNEIDTVAKLSVVLMSIRHHW